MLAVSESSELHLFGQPGMPEVALILPSLFRAQATYLMCNAGSMCKFRINQEQCQDGISTAGAATLRNQIHLAAEP
jgi:hypothetical protein